MRRVATRELRNYARVSCSRKLNHQLGTAVARISGSSPSSTSLTLYALSRPFRLRYRRLSTIILSSLFLRRLTGVPFCRVTAILHLYRPRSSARPLSSCRGQKMLVVARVRSGQDHDTETASHRPSHPERRRTARRDPGGHLHAQLRCRADIARGGNSLSAGEPAALALPGDGPARKRPAEIDAQRFAGAHFPFVLYIACCRTRAPSSNCSTRTTCLSYFAAASATRAAAAAPHQGRRAGKVSAGPAEVRWQLS